MDRITQPIINSVLHGTLENDRCVDEQSFALLLEIQNTLSVFEPIDDDEARKIWLEIPRGSAEEWKAFDDERRGYAAEEDDDLADYQEALDEEFPRETQWLFLVTSTYRENTFLKISDRVHRYVIFTNRALDEKAYPMNMTWLFEPLLKLVQKRVAQIVKDPEAYNRYVEKNVPYRQRSGKIKSKDLNRIIPEGKMQVENREHCIQVMRELMRREEVYESVKNKTPVDWDSLRVPAPFDTMSIRRFCKYYRIADTIFWSESDSKRAKKAVIIEDDVDHYGELGLSRMNVGATNYYVGGKWIITFGISYSAYADEGLKIAMALYETGAPFVFYDAENLLHILEETGTVRISPFTFHDYLEGGDDEGVIALPYEEDCDKEGELTREQYDEIVKLAKWEPDVQLKLDQPIPLDDAVYDLIREKADTPMTLSEIRHCIEKKYDVYLSVARRDGYEGYYYMAPMRNEHLSADKCDGFFPTFNEAMTALILNSKVQGKDN